MGANVFWVVDDDKLDRKDITGIIGSVDPKAEVVPLESYGMVMSACNERKYNDPTVVILDYMLARTSQGYAYGLQALGKIKTLFPTTPVFMLTGASSAQRVLNSLNLLLKYGVLDGYFEKTEQIENLRTRLQYTLAMQDSRSKSLDWADSLNTESDQLVGVAGWMYRDLPRKAILNAPVLIHGPSGSGKELVAHRIHEESFRKGEIIKVNCSAIPDPLFESEFFGYVPGAFTDARIDKKGYFELAKGGTLFLDEIADLSLLGQAKLLRALEDGYYKLGSEAKIDTDVRIISATHKNLDDMVRDGKFRHDLYYRICGVRYSTYGIRDPRFSQKAYETDLELFINRCLAEEYNERKEQSEQYEKVKRNLKCQMKESEDDEFKYAAEMTIQRIGELQKLFAAEALLDSSEDKDEWLGKASSLLGIPRSIPTEKWKELTAHSWPGNYREIRWVVKTVVSEGGWEYAQLEELDRIDGESVESHLNRAAQLYLPDSLSEEGTGGKGGLDNFVGLEGKARVALIQRAYAICHGSRQCMAKILDVKADTVSKDPTYMKLQKQRKDERR